MTVQKATTAISGLLLLFCVAVRAQQSTGEKAEQIRQEIARIRRNTNWYDPQSVQKANEQVQALQKQLQQLQSEGATQPADSREMMWNQILKLAAQGEGTDMLLADPFRGKIVEEYEEERNPEIRNPAFFEELTTLVVDLSTPEGKAIVRQLEDFKAVRRLIITGGRTGAPVALADILRRCVHYPLDELYIINFRAYVTAIPESISAFRKLKILGLFNNSIQKLPASVGAIEGLRTLYVDANPISTLLPHVAKLKQLSQLGIAATNIKASEITQIQQILPDCRILTQ